MAGASTGPATRKAIRWPSTTTPFQVEGIVGAHRQPTWASMASRALPKATTATP